MRRLAFIETSDIGARYSALAARELGYEPIFVCDLKNYQADTLEQIREFEHLDLPTGDAGAIARVLRGLGVSAVTTFLDSRLQIAIEAARLLQARGLDSALLPLKDKGYVQALRPSVMPCSLEIEKNDFRREDVERFLQRPGAFILKPRKTAGAIGARVFPQAPGCEDVVAHMNATEIASFLDPNAWILQEFVEGRLMSLEGFVANGEFTALGITGRKKVGQTESLANFPEDPRLSPEVIEWAHTSCRELLAEAKVQNGYFHIEFISGDTGSAIIDANIGRLGGGGIGELLALSYNVSPVDIFRHVISISIGEKTNSPYARRGGEALSISYGVESAGYFVGLRNLDFLGGYHTQILDGGQSVVAMGGNNWAWIGIATGRAAALQARLDRVEIRMENGIVAPCY